MYVVLWRVCCVCGGTRDVADVGSVMGTRQLPRCRRCSGSGGCAEQAREPDESVLGMYVGCGVGGVVCLCRVLRVCIVLVVAGVPCVYGSYCVVCRICRGTRVVADVGGVWGSGNELGAEGAAAVAGALCKLVNLTSLDLGGTLNVEWVVLRVYVVCCVRELCLSW